MNWVIYFFGSGAAFFSGVGLVLAAIPVLSFYHRKWAMRLATLCALLGLILIALSATPLPYWFYAAAGLVSLVWLVAERVERKRVQNFRTGLRISMVLVWSVGTLTEIPHHIVPTLKPAGRPRLYIFADSVAAAVAAACISTCPHQGAASSSSDEPY